MTEGQATLAGTVLLSEQHDPAEEDNGSSSSSIPVSVWIFGYGSLLWKTNFSYQEKVVGHVRGYARRFWQGSTDHRGVPGAPGRVVTLVQTAEDVSQQLLSNSTLAECTWGVAYKVQPKDVPEVMAYLNHREKGGYTTHTVTFYPINTALATLSALVYIATETNPEFLGPAPLDSLAKQVVNSRGPSGCNVQYLLELAEAMRRIAPLVNDTHLFELERKVKELMDGMSRSERKTRHAAAGMPDCTCCNCDEGESEKDKTLVL